MAGKAGGNHSSGDRLRSVADGLQGVTTPLVLGWTVEGDGLRLSCRTPNGELAFDDWGRSESLRTGEGKPVRVAPALALLDAGRGEVQPDGSLWLPSDAVASLQPANLDGLSLPPAAPFTIRVDKSGIL